MTIHVMERNNPPMQIKEHLRKLSAMNGQDPDLVNGIDGSTEQVGHRLEWVLNDLLNYLCTGKDILQQKANDYMEQMKGQQAKTLQQQIEQEQDGKTMVYLSRNWEIAVYDSIRVLHQNLNLGAALKYRMGQET